MRSLTSASARPLWVPSPESIEPSRCAAFLAFLGASRGLQFAGYDALWQWSVTELEAFWQAVWEFFEVDAGTPPERVLGHRAMPGAEWFSGATLNYAQHMLRDGHAEPAVVGLSQSRPRSALSFDELREQVGRCRAGLIELGVGRGDRVAAYVPNVPEALIALLATASLGAIWSSCAPEFGVATTVSRFGQIAPKVLLAVESYRYGDTLLDRRAELAAIEAGLPGLERTVVIPHAEPASRGRHTWAELVRNPGPCQVRAGAVRPPAVRPLLVGDDGPAEGDRPRPRRHPARAPQDPRLHSTSARATASSGSPPPAG